MKPSSFELVFRDGETYYSGGTIRTSQSKIELFFHYPWGSRTPAQKYSPAHEMREPVYLPDHISFHKDGTVHETSKDGQKRRQHENKLALQENPFNLQRGEFMPLYLESIDIRRGVSDGCRLHRIEETSDRQRERCWDVSSLNHFSIILLSKCTRIHPGRLLSDHGFQLLTTIGPPIILKDVFRAQEKDLLPGGSRSEFGTDILVMAVEESWPERPPLRSQANSEATLISSTVWCPPIDGFSKMINLNVRR